MKFISCYKFFAFCTNFGRILRCFCPCSLRCYTINPVFLFQCVDAKKKKKDNNNNKVFICTLCASETVFSPSSSRFCHVLLLARFYPWSDLPLLVEGWLRTLIYHSYALVSGHLWWQLYIRFGNFFMQPSS